jgi:hypothetical protein
VRDSSRNGDDDHGLGLSFVTTASPSLVNAMVRAICMLSSLTQSAGTRGKIMDSYRIPSALTAATAALGTAVLLAGYAVIGLPWPSRRDEQ